MTYQPLSKHSWPTNSQHLLLRAALTDGEAALGAWRQWKTKHDLEDIDPGSFYITPQLYLNLARLSADHADVQTLRGIYRQTWTRNQIAVRGLECVLRTFSEANIDAIVIKGVPLLLFYYRDMGARMMNDVDVVISEHELLRARHLLEQAGWSIKKDVNMEYLLRYRHALLLNHDHWGPLGIHWCPLALDGPLEAENALWHRCSLVPHRRATFRVPDPTDMLLVTCYHARQANARSVCRWVVDALQLMQAADPAIDWDALLARAQEAGLLPQVRDALTYLHEKFPNMIPTDFIRRAWAIHAPHADIVRYGQMITPHSERNIRQRVAYHWWRYGATYRRRRRPVNPLELAWSLSSYGRMVFSGRSGWRVFGRVVRRLAGGWRRVDEHADGVPATQGNARRATEP